MGHDPGWGYVKAGLVGALAAAVIMLSFPVVAAVGGNLVLGQGNSADAVTSLSGAATANLRISNTQAGAPAVDLRVASGAAPLKVNSTTRVANLNADRVDGKHSGAFALLGHTHTGVYLPIGGQAADSDLLDRLDSTAFARRGAVCPPGETLVGYDRSGPLCSSRVGSVTVDSAGNVGWYTSMVLDASGFPVIAYHDGTNGDLELVHCGNADCTAGNVFHTLDTAGNVGWYPSLVLDASGFPVISYWDFTNSDLKVAYCGDSTCETGNVFRSVDTTGNVGVFPSLVLDASGFPVISYYDSTNGDLKVVHCGDATCEAGNVFSPVDTAGDVGWRTSLTLDTSGFPVISYYDSTNKDLKLVHCGDAACGSGNTITAVDSTGDVGKCTSLVLDASGFPVVSYYDVANEALKVAHCGDATCGTGNAIRFIDTVGSLGLPTSLVLDMSGFPVIAYTDVDGYDLKVAHCADPTCASHTVTSVDVDGDVGPHASLALDASGHPIVSYYDITNGDLKLAAAVA
jgi:hypothetical protein